MRLINRYLLIVTTFVFTTILHAQKPQISTEVFEEDVMQKQRAEDEAQRIEDEKNAWWNVGGVFSSDTPTKEDPGILHEETFDTEHWVGLQLVFQNHGLGKGFWKISQDDILLGKAPEKTIGLLGHIELGWTEALTESFRFQFGLLRSSVGISEALKDQYGAERLENALHLVHLSFLWKRALIETGQGLWWGAGAYTNYAWGSSTPAGSNSDRISKLRNSYAVGPVLAVGMDIPHSRAQELCIEVDWMPWKGIMLGFGIRTRL